MLSTSEPYHFKPGIYTTTDGRTAVVLEDIEQSHLYTHTYESTDKPLIGYVATNNGDVLPMSWTREGYRINAEIEDDYDLTPPKE